MEKEYTIKEGLEWNLKLIVENARDLMVVFKHDETRKEQLKKFVIVGLTTLSRLYEGVYEGKEQEMFDAFMPSCAYLNQQWHKYCKQINL